MKEKKRLKLRRNLITFVLLITLGISLGVGLSFLTPFSSKPESEPQPVEAVPFGPMPPSVMESEASMIMVGDALIHEAVYNDAKTSDGYAFTSMLENIKL